MNPKLRAQRATIADLQRQIADTSTAGRTRAELRDALAAYLQQVEADGARALSRRVADVADGRSPHGLVAPLGSDLGPVLLALLGADTVAAALDRHVQARPEGMDAATRAERLRKLRADLFAAEVAEEALIVTAESRGEQVDRRADADCAAVLYVAD